MSVDFLTVKSVVLEMLNAAESIYGTIDGTWTRISEDGINDVILNKDLRAPKAICETIGHPRRPDFMTEATISSGDTLPSSIGPVGPVFITSTELGEVTGTPAPADKIRRWQDDADNNAGAVYGGAEVIDGYYDTLGNNTLVFTGVTARVKYADFERKELDGSPPNVVLNTPEECIDMLASDILGFLYNKESDQAAAANDMSNYATLCEQIIRTGKMDFPQFQISQMQR